MTWASEKCHQNVGSTFHSKLFVFSNSVGWIKKIHVAMEFDLIF